jgi:hypothetical protein
VAKLKTAVVPTMLRDALYRLLAQGREQGNEFLITDAKHRCLETLLRIFGNVATEPTEAKFRMLRSENAGFKGRVLRCVGGLDTMLAIGFESRRQPHESTAYVLPDGADLVLVATARDLVQALLACAARTAAWSAAEVRATELTLHWKYRACPDLPWKRPGWGDPAPVMPAVI